jgi:hypothetical protein
VSKYRIYQIDAFTRNRFEGNPAGVVANADGSMNPIVAKVGGLQSQGAKGEAVVNQLRLLGNAGSGVLRLSRLVGSKLGARSPKGKQHGIKLIPSFEFTLGWKSKMGVFR